MSRQSGSIRERRAESSDAMAEGAARMFKEPTARTNEPYGLQRKPTERHQKPATCRVSRRRCWRSRRVLVLADGWICAVTAFPSSRIE